MPLPMVHLGIAVRVCELSSNALASTFLLGSIAPDAIHMRPGANRNDKDLTHLQDMPGANEHERFRDFLTASWAAGPAAKAFAVGYVAHLLADRLWVQTLLSSYWARVPPALPNDALRGLYYQEVDWVDLDLYRRMPWRQAVWAQLAAVAPRDIPSVLTADEIAQWRDRTLRWYEAPERGSLEPPVYITKAEVETFIAEAAQSIAAHLSDWKAGPAG